MASRCKTLASVECARSGLSDGWNAHLLEEDLAELLGDPMLKRRPTSS